MPLNPAHRGSIRWISEFKASLIYRGSFKTAISKKEKTKRKKKKNQKVVLKYILLYFLGNMFNILHVFPLTNRHYYELYLLY